MTLSGAHPQSRDKEMDDVMVKIHDDPWVADEKVLSFDAMHWVMCPLLRAGGEAVGARPPLTGHMGQPLESPGSKRTS